MGVNATNLINFDSGPGAIDYIIDHAEIDYVFVHPYKVNEVSHVHAFVLFSCLLVMFVYVTYLAVTYA